MKAKNGFANKITQVVPDDPLISDHYFKVYEDVISNDSLLDDGGN